MKLFMLAASVSATSLNKKLIENAAGIARDAGHEVTVGDFASYLPPLYDANVNKSEGIPAEATQFSSVLSAYDAIVISSPEYNFSMPGTLKNLIDWVSRIKPNPFKGKRMLLLSASPSMMGGNRGLWSLRVPLEGLGVFVFPTMYSLSHANEMFAEDGTFTDSKRKESLTNLLSEFTSQ